MATFKEVIVNPHHLGAGHNIANGEGVLDENYETREIQITVPLTVDYSIDPNRAHYTFTIFGRASHQSKPLEYKRMYYRDRDNTNTTFSTLPDY